MAYRRTIEPIGPAPALTAPGPWNPRLSALFLDLDGTLAAIEQRPEDVMAQPWRSRLLRRLQVRLDGRLAVASGRPLDEIDRILDGTVTAVAAVHGLVRRRPDGALVRVDPPPGLARARDQLMRLVRSHEGLSLEDKGVGVALHYRAAPGFGALALSTAERVAREENLKLQPGDKVVEVCTPGFDKGSAVRAFMHESPFEGSSPIFVGDDLTDENGFEAALELGGFGILAGPARPTAAQWRLTDVGAVRRWLEAGLTRRSSAP